eukprot:scaffold17849_cov95-Skeletonema_dohrnii-CCMP3373.AAC.2
MSNNHERQGLCLKARSWPASVEGNDAEPLEDSKQFYVSSRRRVTTGYNNKVANLADTGSSFTSSIDVVGTYISHQGNRTAEEGKR